MPVPGCQPPGSEMTPETDCLVDPPAIFKVPSSDNTVLFGIANGGGSYLVDGISIQQQ